MSAWASGDTLTPSTLNRKLSSAVSSGGFSTNTLVPDAGVQIVVRPNGESGTTQFRSDTGIEIQRSTDAGMSMLMTAGSAGTTAYEGFIAFGAPDDSGTPRKLASLSAKWHTSSATTGVGFMRLNATYRSGGVTNDDVQLRLYGGQGAAFFASGDNVAPPGSGVLAVNGKVDTSALSASVATIFLLDVAAGGAGSPSIRFGAESALGWYRSGSSTMGLSYGTLTASVISTDGAYHASRLTSAGGIDLAAASQSVPSIRFGADPTIGIWRSGSSTLAISNGTFDLTAVRVSVRTTGSSLNSTNVGVNELAIFVGGTSGASLALRSGGTIYFFSSSASTVG